ncbi:hypothetical protein ES703_69602 [subsurface metagenome]
MGKFYLDWEVVCHWCGKHFMAKRGRLEVRFCSAKCKMAHHRAYKRYVTRTAGSC